MLAGKRRTQIKRRPRQQRSQARFEAVLNAALRLFAVHGYESVSMREIARAAKMPIATVYQYFPMKLAIVREIWTRYTLTISKTLAEEIRRADLDVSNDLTGIIGTIVDRMAELQASNPAFIEVWSCVGASIELRALNAEDTIQNAQLIASALHKKHPKVDRTVLSDRALIAIEMASSTTRFALALTEPHRARILLALKRSLSLLLESGTSTELGAWSAH
jgi:AcrR family transcriptional regulator